MEEQWITSVGIDLGTSTTKFIVSQLRLGRMSSTFSLPRFQIVERKLVYASPIYLTPLQNREEIDIEKVSLLLQDEYKKAQIQLSDIKTGAVIITGESATKRNAEQIVHFLAERSGDFVVATAGSDLEGLLAGKGSGASARSKQIHGTIANIDIGGGTANIALFHRGKVVGTVTFHVGGRLIRLDQNGMIQYVSPSIQTWLQTNGYTLEVGESYTFSELKEITTLLNRSMLNYLVGKGNELHSDLIMLGSPLIEIPPIEEIMISGGIGHLLHHDSPQTLQEVAVYGDMGPLLAYTLQTSLLSYPFQVISPEQTVRATVIGAGMQSTEISGSTIYMKPSLLPIRNIPVLKLEITEQHLQRADDVQNVVEQVMKLGSRLFNTNTNTSPPFAIALTRMTYCSYSSLQLLADVLAGSFKAHFSTSKLFVLICENDMAKALGQSLAIRCQETPQVICIDQVTVEHGDYIDLGEPISETMIPVVIKTLAFHESSSGVTR